MGIGWERGNWTVSRDGGWGAGSGRPDACSAAITCLVLAETHRPRRRDEGALIYYQAGRYAGDATGRLEPRNPGTCGFRFLAAGLVAAQTS